jgi:hypothetical protein
LRSFGRYVAIGDSTAEGLDDPDGRGGYRGWADRLAERIALAQGGLLDANAVGRDMELMQTALVRQGATVVSFTLPDLVPVMPIARPLRPRVHRLARALAAASARSGAILLDFVLPWLARHARGRSSGDGRFAKRPELRVVELPRSVVE